MIKDQAQYDRLCNQLKTAWRARDQYPKGSAQWDTFENQASSIRDMMSELNPELTNAEANAMYRFM